MMGRSDTIYSITCTRKRPINSNVGKSADKCSLSCQHLFYENGGYICNIGKMKMNGKKGKG